MRIAAANQHQREVVGATTNPTIFANAITESDAYIAQIRGLSASSAGVTEAMRVF